MVCVCAAHNHFTMRLRKRVLKSTALCRIYIYVVLETSPRNRKIAFQISFAFTKAIAPHIKTWLYGAVRCIWELLNHFLYFPPTPLCRCSRCIFLIRTTTAGCHGNVIGFHLTWKFLRKRWKKYRTRTKKNITKRQFLLLLFVASLNSLGDATFLYISCHYTLPLTRQTIFHNLPRQVMFCGMNEKKIDRESLSGVCAGRTGVQAYTSCSVHENRMSDYFIDGSNDFIISHF